MTLPQTIENDRPLLVVRHVAWEGPHRLLASFADSPVQICDPLDTDVALPDPRTVRGAVFMGGPMSVNDVARFPRLAEEISWLSDAVALEVPVLGVCLGAQLLAKASGATITAAPEVELGVSEVGIVDRDDPLARHLAPAAAALHWHGEQFDLPAGAAWLARSAQTDIQAFRVGPNAWGLLFHLEADEQLLDVWLAEPTMAAEAEAALGPNYDQLLRADLAQLDQAGSKALFDEFAACCARNVEDRVAAL